MSEYQLTATDSTVIRTKDQAFIPNDPANRDWIEYQKWLADGGVPNPLPPVVVATLDSVGNAKTTAQILGAA